MSKTVGNDESGCINKLSELELYKMFFKMKVHDLIRFSKTSTDFQNKVNNYLLWVDNKINAVNNEGVTIQKTKVNDELTYCIIDNDNNIYILDEIVDGVGTIIKVEKILDMLKPTANNENSTENEKYTKIKKKLHHIEFFSKILNEYIELCNEQMMYDKNEKCNDVVPWGKYLEIFLKKKTEIERLEQVITSFTAGGKPRRRSFESLTVPQLKEYAKRKEIRGYSKLNKAELIAALRKTRK